MSTRGSFLTALALDAVLAKHSPQAVLEVALLAETAGVDLLVLGGPDRRLDPIILASWLAPRIRRAGLVTVLPALTTLPFHTARSLSAIDILSRGRSGWAPIARTADPQGVAKAADFIGATCSLWDGWAPDALIIDKQSGRYLDPDKVRRMDYRGPFFQVKGPLNAARPAQGHPVLVQFDEDPLSEAVRTSLDVLVCETPTSERLAAHRQRLAAGQKLIARVGVDAISAASDWVGSGRADGVLLAPTDAASLTALLAAASTIAPPDRRPAADLTLRERYGLAPRAAAELRTA